MTGHEHAHTVAMQLCDAADAVRGSMPTLARAYYSAAYTLERAAAEAEPSQPWRAILHRSAATLALQAGYPVDAMEVCMAALDEPGIPGRYRDELIAVYSEARGAS